MKAQDQVHAKEKRAVSRKTILILAIVVLGLLAGVIFGEFYFVRGFVLVLIIGTFLVFLGAHLAVIGILCRASLETFLQSLRNPNPRTSAQTEPSRERQPASVPDSRTIGTAARADTP